MPTKGISSFATRWFHKLFTKALGIKIHVAGLPNKDATLFLSNHISWLDILIIGQIIPTHFLSMIEVKSWPVAGWLATRAGTLYIHRGGKQSTDKSLNEITQVLNEKHNVVVFPEGRTTDGTLRKFHSRLVQSAVNANSYVQPIALKYTNGTSLQANPAVLFIGDTTFTQSLFNILAQKSISVEVNFLEPIHAADQLRSKITSDAENQMRKQLRQD